MTAQSFTDGRPTYAPETADRHLRVAIPATSPEAAPETAPEAARERSRPNVRGLSGLSERIVPILELAAGNPIVVTRDEVKWTRLADACQTLTNITVLDITLDPALHTPAQALVDDILVRHGIMRDAGGARMLGIATDLNRWLLPFLIETTAALPEHLRGIGQGTRSMYGALPLVLSGAAAMPACTVAADLLTTKKDPHLGVMCLWLPLDKAGHVVTGGPDALEVALADGRLHPAADVRTGEPLLSAAALRDAGLLIEPEKPHGLSESTAGNVTTLLKNAAQHARDLGAHVPGDWAFRARKPLFVQRQVRRRTDKRDVGFDEIASLSPHLPVIGQLVVWSEALLGVRISEGYGPIVADFSRRDAVPYLKLRRQSGHQMTDRDDLGLFFAADTKMGLKTDESTREIAIPESLAALIELVIEIFHTDAATGHVNTAARLVPGLQKDDASGASTFRAWLDRAIEARGIERRFTPHALRGSLIQVLREEGVSKELRFRYVGHRDGRDDIQESHYNYESRPWELIPVAEAIERRLCAAVPAGPTGFRLAAPTTAREQFGVGTRQHERREATAAMLRSVGWWVDSHVEVGKRTNLGDGDSQDRGRLLSSEEVGRRLGCTAATARRQMREGSIPAVSVAQGKRQVWKTFEVDLDAFITNRGMTVQEIATEVELSYHQVYELLESLHLIPNARVPGTAIRINAEGVDAVRAEVTRRREVHLEAMYVTQAADVLQLGAEAVEALIRNGTFTTVPAPNGARARLVPNAQVDAFKAAHPKAKAPQAFDPHDAVPFGEAARRLGVTRSVLGALVLTRQIVSVKRPGSRHQYVTRTSLEAHFARTEQSRV